MAALPDPWFSGRPNNDVHILYGLTGSTFTRLSITEGNNNHAGCVFLAVQAPCGK